MSDQPPNHLTTQQLSQLTIRPRRLRRHPLLRDMVRETTLSASDFILPLFVRAGHGIRQEIASMPGNFN